MGKLNDIKEKLLASSTTKQLIEQGYAKSSVFSVAKKLNKLQPAIPTSPVPDELAELRKRKETVKLEKEIAELEAAKDRLPNRVDSLESKLEGQHERISFLEKQLDRALDASEDLLFELHGLTLSLQFDEYGACYSRKRTEHDRDLSEKKASEFIRKYRLERASQELDYN